MTEPSRACPSRAGPAGPGRHEAATPGADAVADAGPADVVVIGGPTASGKSALALDLAEALGGTVINADSMQVYRDLAVLTARPGAEALARAPHQLYGMLDAADVCSAGRWRDLAMAEIGAARAAGRVPIVVGGTGLYLKALTGGLSAIPAVPPAIRRAAIERHRALGGAAFRAELAARDPVMAARLEPGDTQRLIRAWEVWEATGRSLAAWQAEAPDPAGLRFMLVLLMPPRPALYEACDSRFLAMLDRGALDELRRLDARSLDPDLPIMKALGVPELRAHLNGELPLDEAIRRAQQATRNYAKRQLTWFRHQPPWAAGEVERVHGRHVVNAQYSESFLPEILQKVRISR